MREVTLMSADMAPVADASRTGRAIIKRIFASFDAPVEGPVRVRKRNIVRVVNVTRDVRICDVTPSQMMQRIGADPGDLRRSILGLASHAVASATRAGFSTIGRLISADKMPSRIESHHTTS